MVCSTFSLCTVGDVWRLLNWRSSQFSCSTDSKTNSIYEPLLSMWYLRSRNLNKQVSLVWFSNFGLYFPPRSRLAEDSHSFEKKNYVTLDHCRNKRRTNLCKFKQNDSTDLFVTNTVHKNKKRHLLANST